MGAGRWCVIPADIALDSSLSLTEYRVLMVIGAHSNKKGWCKLKLASIAEEGGMAEVTARKAVKSLEGRGYLKKVRHRTYCDYQIICDRSEDIAQEEDRYDNIDQDCSEDIDQDRSEGIAPYRTGLGEQVKGNNISCPKPQKRISYPEEFQEFWSEYPTDQIMSKKMAFQEWKKLPPDDRIAALNACKPFIAYCKSKPDYRPVHAERFLKQRRFDGFSGGVVTPPSKYLTLKSTDPGYSEWVEYYVKKTGNPYQRELFEPGGEYFDRMIVETQYPPN